MNRQQLKTLLFPSIFLVALSVFSLFASAKNIQLQRATAENHSTFQKLIDDIKSGKRSFTTDQWIDALRATETWAEANRSLINALSVSFGVIGIFSLVMALINLSRVLKIKKDLSKQ